MGRESKSEVDRLRSKARRLDVTIRTQRGSGTSGSRAFTLIDRRTGAVICANVDGVADLQTQLWWIARDRTRALSNEHPPHELPQELCPSCGTPRVAFFRLCLSCGLDYEASGESGPGMAPPTGVDEPVGGSPRSVPEPSPARRWPATRRRLTAPLARLGYAVSDLYQSGAARELVVGAVIGLLIGLTVTLAVAAIR